MTTFPAVLVTGARQTGKTTLLREEFGETHRYVSLERPDVRARAQSDPVSFLEQNSAPVILDEIQYVPDLLHYIKDKIDEDRAPGRWLLTGSQSFSLMKGISQTLAGRVAVLTLDPLSVSEAAELAVEPSFEKLLHRVFDGGGPGGSADEANTIDLADWLLRGGFPELRLSPRVDRTLWLSSYVQTYLERDVRDLTQVADLATFGRFLATVGARTGTVVNMSQLGREVGVSGPTAKRWLSVLETSQLVYLLQPYYRNFGKRIRRSPKLYLLDPGLATYFLSLHSPDAVLHGPSVGALVETLVVGEWLKSFRQRGEEPSLYFWESGPTGEVDLVVERDGRLYGVEVKATATPVPRHADALAQWLALAGDEAKGALACRVDRPVPLRPRVRAVPWHLAW